MLNVDDDNLYVVHDEGEGQGEWSAGVTKGHGGVNINRFRDPMAVESSSEEEETTSSNEVSWEGGREGINE